MIRPPIITIMGHVDHGKTTLLDYIRKTQVTARESGGITQHINAYQIFQPHKITFIDTPGHAAFQEMRARGGRVADIVILIIAANEGIKPQTVESLDHIKQAGVPLIVAINKIDLPETNVPMVKQQLSELGYLPEDMGGDIITVPLSATTGQGVDQLLEMIALVAEMQNLEADPKAELTAVVIESELDKHRGPVTNLIIRNGTLHIGDQIYVEHNKGKVKALFNYLGQPIDQAGPSDPVQVLGFSQVPTVGSAVHTGNPVDFPAIEDRKQVVKNSQPDGNLDNQKLPIILRTDKLGSEEAIKNMLPEGIVILESKVGNITENDILTAKTMKAEVIGFHIGLTGQIKKLAEIEEVKVKNFTIIYELYDYLADQYQRLINPFYGINIQAEAEIINEFKINKTRIAGARIISGELHPDHQIIITRDQQVIGHSKIKTLKHGKTDVNKVAVNVEFGITFHRYIDFKIGDKLTAY